MISLPLKGALLHAIEIAERGEMSQPEAAEYAKCSIATFKRRIKEYRIKEGRV